MSKPIKIWTDGACVPNPGVGGWAWTNERGVQASGRVLATTNNRMELTAAIEAIRAHAGHEFVLITDSNYVVNGATKWTLERLDRKSKKGNFVPNRDLWLQLFAAMANAKVRFQWVRGHSGESGNEYADRLANAAATGNPFD